MKLLKTLLTIVFVSTLSLSINAKEIKMGKADWDTGYFQAEVYKKALEKMGYKVTGPTVMKPQILCCSSSRRYGSLGMDGLETMTHLPKLNL